MNLPINTTYDGTAFAVTVSMPNNAQLCKWNGEDNQEPIGGLFA